MSDGKWIVGHGRDHRAFEFLKKCKCASKSKSIAGLDEKNGGTITCACGVQYARRFRSKGEVNDMR